MVTSPRSFGTSRGRCKFSLETWTATSLAGTLTWNATRFGRDPQYEQKRFDLAAIPLPGAHPSKNCRRRQCRGQGGHERYDELAQKGGMSCTCRPVRLQPPATKQSMT